MNHHNHQNYNYNHNHNHSHNHMMIMMIDAGDDFHDDCRCYHGNNYDDGYYDYHYSFHSTPTTHIILQEIYSA